MGASKSKDLSYVSPMGTSVVSGAPPPKGLGSPHRQVFQPQVSCAIDSIPPVLLCAWAHLPPMGFLGELVLFRLYCRWATSAAPSLT